MKRVALFAFVAVLCVAPAFGEGESADSFLYSSETSLDSHFLVKPELQVQDRGSLEYLSYLQDETSSEDAGMVRTTLGRAFDTTKKFFGAPLKKLGFLPGEKDRAKAEDPPLDEKGRLRVLALNAPATEVDLFTREDAKRLVSQKTVENFSSEPTEKKKRFGDKLIKILVLTRDFGPED